MKPHLGIAILVLLGGCVTSSNQYLKTVYVDIPLSAFGHRSEEMANEKKTCEAGPFPDDFPPSRVIIFEDKRPYKIFATGRPVYAFPAYNVVRLYDVKNIAPERTISRYIKDLKQALNDRRSAKALEQPFTSLPDYPLRNAGHLVQVKVDYVDFAWGSGVFYLVQFTQGPGNFPDNDELIYTFQGISHDGRLYVAADFRVFSNLLSKTSTPTSGDDVDEAVTNIGRRLDKEADSAFSPDLSIIRSWMGAIKIPKS